MTCYCRADDEDYLCDDCVADDDRPNFPFSHRKTYKACQEITGKRNSYRVIVDMVYNAVALVAVVCDPVVSKDRFISYDLRSVVMEMTLFDFPIRNYGIGSNNVPVDVEFMDGYQIIGEFSIVSIANDYDGESPVPTITEVKLASPAPYFSMYKDGKCHQYLGFIGEEVKRTRFDIEKQEFVLLDSIKGITNGRS